MESSSWLFPHDTDRERMLDMDLRLQPVRRAALAVLAVALIACGPWIGWWTLIPLAVAAALFGLADRRMETAARPEYWIFAAWAASQVIIAVSVALSGGPTVPTMSWFAIPVVTLSARFPARGIVAGIVLTLALLVTVAFVVDSAAVLDDPSLVIVPAALVIAVAILSTALMQSDREHRTEVVVDELTGLLNRRALTARTHELEFQSQVTGEPVAVILGDLDDFKAVNDRGGHAAGDVALREVASALRQRLRAFDLVYRFGGDEFLILVPGASIGKAKALAERLRAAVSASTDGRHPITMSFGVAASSRGAPFRYAEVFARADAALYEAKRAGSDCVRGPDRARSTPSLAFAEWRSPQPSSSSLPLSGS